MPLILGANETKVTGYNVDNSCMFNDGDSAAMSRDQSANSAGTNTKGTLSVWLKMSAAGTEQVIYTRETDASNYFKVWFENDRLLIQTVTSGSVTMKKETNRVFRDPGAWLNIVVILDSTDGTAADRQQIWINGVRETSFGTSTNIGSSANLQINTGTGTDYIGRRGSGNYYDGYMAELVWIDGTDYAATSFGEYDEDSPTIWKPIDVSGLTFGTNGFYLDFEASGNLGNDVNGGTDFTESNLAATDQATDSCTNNFATINPLDNYYANSTFSEGNCTIVQGSSTYAHNTSTIAVTAGKWYVEAKLTTDSEHALVGITDTPALGTGTKILGSAAHDYSIKQANGDLFNNRGDDPANDATDYAAAYAQNDIIGIALDCDNNKLYFSKGGAWSDGSGSWDSTTFNASVGAITITAPASTDNGHYFFASGDYGSASCTWEWNFGGCPPFSISSGNADGNGYGNFEYAPPSGFLALCTKNLGSDGG